MGAEDPAIFEGSHEDCRAGAIAVVLPAPGGATSATGALAASAVRKAGTIRIHHATFVDVGVTRPQAFAAIKDATTT